MAITLDSIRRGPRLGPPRMIVYGPHGVGKTTFGAQAPSPILIPLEDGQGKIDIPTFDPHGSGVLKSYAEVIEALDALFTSQHDFQTALVDSLDWLEPLVWKETCARNEWHDIESPGFGKGYVAADEVWREFFAWLAALRDQRHMSIILLSHCEVKKFNDPDNEPYDRYQIKLHHRASGIAQEWADAVLFANYKIYVQKHDAGFKKTIARGKGDGERVFYTEERPAHFAKNRYSLPSEMPFPQFGAYDNLMNHIFGSPSPQQAEQQSAA